MTKKKKSEKAFRFLEIDGTIIGPVHGQGPVRLYPDKECLEFNPLVGKVFAADFELIDAIRELSPKARDVAIRVDDEAVLKMAAQFGVFGPKSGIQ